MGGEGKKFVNLLVLQSSFTKTCSALSAVYIYKHVTKADVSSLKASKPPYCYKYKR